MVPNYFNCFVFIVLKQQL